MSILCGEETNDVNCDDESCRVIDDEDNVELEESKVDENRCSESERTRNSFLSLFGEVSIYRDFFFAAFSDGYNNVTCCSAEGFFPGRADLRGAASSVKPYGDVASSASNKPLSSSERSRKRRNKPLAVAVGFKYANDYDGRPIVITPGGRKSPNSIVTRSLMDPYHNARKMQRNETKTPPQLPDLSAACIIPTGTVDEDPAA